jgi:hypothetical protein
MKLKESYEDPKLKPFREFETILKPRGYEHTGGNPTGREPNWRFEHQRRPNDAVTVSPNGQWIRETDGQVHKVDRGTERLKEHLRSLKEGRSAIMNEDIHDFITAIVNNDHAQANMLFDNIITNKISGALDAAKSIIGQSMFDNTNQS